MVTFDEYVDGYTDIKFLEYLRAYFEYGNKARKLSADHNDIFDAFKVVHTAGALEALIDEMGVYPDPDSTEIEIEFDSIMFEIIPRDYVYEMIETTYQVGQFLNVIPENLKFEKDVLVGKLLGAFLLGLGYDPDTYMETHMRIKMDYIHPTVYLN